MEPELSLTDKVVSTLRKMPKISDGVVARPSSQAIRQTKKILADFEASKLPYPTICASKAGVGLLWSSYDREVHLLIDQQGDMVFASSLKHYNKDGELVSTLNGEGPIEGMKGIGQMMAWYLCSVSAKA